MAPIQHPVRDGVVAVVVGGLLAVALVVGVRAAQLWPMSAPAGQPGAPVDQPGGPGDACQLRDGGEGGGPKEPDPVPGPDFPRSEHELDSGRPVDVRGTGNAEVAYRRLAEFATVVDFECHNCTGLVSVFNTGASLPVVSGESAGEPVEVEWLIDTVHELTQTTDNSLLIQADGDWRLTLRSWHDLPVETSRVEGSGSRVVRMETPSVRMTFAPLNSRDTLNVYAYRLEDRGFTANACVGRFEARTVDLNEGNVLLVWARGEWSLEPA